MRRQSTKFEIGSARKQLGRRCVRSYFTVTAVTARHFATRDGTMRASHAVLAFGLLVASAATVTANHNDGGAHTFTGNTLDGASPLDVRHFRRHPNSRRSFKRARTTTRSDALRVSPRGVCVLPVLALAAGLLRAPTCHRGACAVTRCHPIGFFSRCEREYPLPFHKPI